MDCQDFSDEREQECRLEFQPAEFSTPSGVLTAFVAPLRSYVQELMDAVTFLMRKRVQFAVRKFF